MFSPAFYGVIAQMSFGSQVKRTLLLCLLPQHFPYKCGIRFTSTWKIDMIMINLSMGCQVTPTAFSFWMIIYSFHITMGGQRSKM
jgi:hypothetical protein